MRHDAGPARLATTVRDPERVGGRLAGAPTSPLLTGHFARNPCGFRRTWQREEPSGDLGPAGRPRSWAEGSPVGLSPRVRRGSPLRTFRFCRRSFSVKYMADGYQSSRPGVLPESLEVPMAAVDISVLHPPSGDWRDDAACKGKFHLFFAPRAERPQARVRREAQARRLCASCPVQVTCRQFARTNHEYGFWGGESEEERHLAGYTVAAPIGVRARVARAERERELEDEHGHALPDAESA